MNLNEIVITLTICHKSPKAMCYFLSTIDCEWILTTIHPIDLADEIAKLRFYDFWKMFKGWDLLIAISRMVPGTATLINLLSQKKSTIREYHQQ